MFIIKNRRIMRKLLMFYLIVNCSSSFSQNDTCTSFMAVLKVDTCVNATINDSVMFTVKPGQKFIYEKNSEGIFLENGQFGGISNNLVKGLKTLILKLILGRVILKSINMMKL